MATGSFPTALTLLAALAAALAPGIARADPADDQYATAIGLYARQDWQLAAKELQAFLAKSPGHAQAGHAAFYLGEAQLQLRRYEEARASFADYLKREPQGALASKALFRCGEAARLGGQNDQAAVLLKDFLAKHADDPLNAYVLTYLGEIALAGKDYKAAGEWFGQGLSRFPNGPRQDDCRFGLAQALQHQGQHEEAQRLYVALAGKIGNPLAPDAQFCLAALQYELRKFAEAADSFQEFEKKFASSPLLPTARRYRGFALFQLDRLDEAKAVFEGLAADPALGIEARYWTGRIQRAQKQWAEAAKTLIAAGDADPKHPLLAAVRFHAGDALMRAGDPGAAQKQLDLAIAASGEAGEWLDDAWRAKVQAALEAKDHALVDQAAAEFLKRCPGSLLVGDVARSRARSLIQRKDFGEAAKVLEPLASAAGADEPALTARYLLALAYEGLGRAQDALAQLAPVLQSGHAALKRDAQLAEAGLRISLKQYAEAIPPLEACLAADPGAAEAPGAKARLAVCYAWTKQLDKARKLYGELVEKHASEPSLAAATEQLAEAALAAGDPEWSAALFGRMAGAGAGEGAELRGLSGQGWSHFRAGRLEEAAATMARLLAKDPPEALAADAALLRGTVLAKLQQPDAALAMFDLVIDKYPKSAQYGGAVLAAARLRDALKQHERAAALFERYVGAFPQAEDLDKVLYDWAWALAELGRDDASAAAFERICKEYPKSPYWPDAAFRLAQRALKAGDLGRAGELAAAVLAAQPKPEIRRHALYLQGQVLAAQDKWEEVGAVFAALAKECPEGPLRRSAEFWVAESSFRRKDYGAAGKQLDEIARQAQGPGESWAALAALRRAQVFAHQKQWDEALAAASKIAGQYPEFEQLYEADYVIGRALAMKARFDEAREAFQRVTASPHGAKTETAAMAQWHVGETYFHQKDYEAALLAYLRVEILYAFPEWQALALLEAARCREMLGEWNEAVKIYERLLENYPNAPAREEAKKRLQEARGRLAGKP